MIADYNPTKKSPFLRSVALLRGEVCDSRASVAIKSATRRENVPETSEIGKRIIKR